MFKKISCIQEIDQLREGDIIIGKDESGHNLTKPFEIKNIDNGKIYAVNTSDPGQTIMKIFQAKQLIAGNWWVH